MKKLSAVAILSTLSLIPSGAQASGFALNEESASVLGTAFAGAAVANEPAVQFTNPAGISGLKGNQIEVGGTLYSIDAPSFRNNGTTTLSGAAANGGTGADNQTLAAPFGYYTHELDHGLTFGVGIYSPFGLATSYDPTWVGRYSSIDSNVNSTEFSPVLSYQATPQLAVGFGPTFRYTEARLTQAIDFGGLVNASQASDGYGKIEGDGFGYGFKLGAKYTPTDDTTLGFGYRSRMTTRLTGQAHYGLSPAGQIVSASSHAFTSSGIDADLDTPQSADISIAQRVTQPLTLYGDVLWTGWSTFKDLDISYDNPYQPTTLINEKWRDTFRLSVGASYDLTSDWTLRTGYSYDQSPVKNAAYTTARVPDGDRHWLAVGAGYKVSDALRIDAAFDHLFLNSASSTNAQTNAGTLNGEWNSVGANLFTLSAIYSF